MKGFKKTSRKVISAILTAAMVLGVMPQLPAAEVKAATYSGALSSAESATADGNIVTVTFNDGVQAKITFLEDDIFRYNVDPSGAFSEYAKTVYGNSTKIPQYPDSSEEYTHPDASVSEEDGYIVITSGNTTIKFEKATAKMSVEYKGNVVMEESEPLTLGSQTTQSLVKHDSENFYGGGTQNGRFVHTGESINIVNEGHWEDGDVTSPSPFYYTSEGYGVLRNTFLPGAYDFGSTSADTVTTVHEENEFDAYYFLSDGTNATEVVQDILNGYYHVTGNPVLLPEYAFYEGHLNAYNRDSWSETSGSKAWPIKGSNSASGSETLTNYRESGMLSGYVLPENAQSESLNGEEGVLTTALDNYPDGVTTPYKFSARAVIDQYIEMDMPLGFFLPNDGYGTGYGQNGYYVTGGVNADGSSSAERLAAVAANVQNLAKFTEYANSKGVATGLWTQSYLVPDSNANTFWHLLRDFEQEVKVGGITTLKTDVAWVGPGYDMALNATKTAYDIVTTGVNKRPNIITLCGWAGTQRFGAIWTGDQYGGNWEYIRFHIPTYIGQSLSGNPNVGSDMDGIFSGSALITTRDTQWKIFTPLMLNMDGWGSYAKTPQTFGDPYTGINRMYLKLKAQLLPYLYTSAASAANIDTGNNDTGLPMIRAMFLEYPDDEYAATKAMQYQYMFGKNVLVAPIYTETDAIDEQGNDVRNGIYLPNDTEAADEPEALAETGESVTEIFKDVTAGSWYEEAVQYVFDKGLMTGIDENLFAPAKDMTRGMFVTTLYRLAGEPEVTDRKACTELKDVAENAWYTDAVCWAYANGITTGYESDMTFRTNVALTREQLATFVYRYAQVQGLNTDATSDLEGLQNADKVKDFAKEAVKWAVGVGLISGMEVEDESGNTVYDLAPQKTATRAQMAQILMRFCQWIEGSDTQEGTIWIDYFTGKQYNGGQVLNNFDAPIWKLPVFVKNGAIIPMWEENNSPAQIDKSNRIAEFWPAGSTEYTLYEDNGTDVTNTTEEVNGYGTVADIDYGEHVSTKYTSVVSGTTATLTAEKSTGTYDGYDQNKNTTFIVNVSAEPANVTAKNGDTTLTKVAKNSKEEVLNAELAAGEFAYYYDEAPAIETYAVDGEDEFAEMMEGQVSSPKLYVKFAETDSQANAQVLTIEGFENVDEDLPANVKDENLAVPANLADDADAKTPTSNTIKWEAVEGATSYDLEIDGIAQNVGNVTSFTHTDLDYHSTHTYKVRARGANGYSDWSDMIEATTDLDPWRNVPASTITWEGGEQWGALVNATDHDTSTMFHSTGDVVTGAIPFIMDFGDGYTLDKFEYYPRENYGNGTVKTMDIYTSLDGVHWRQVYEGTEDWTYDNDLSVEENVKTVSLDGIGARYVKLIVTKSIGSFFSANELAVYKQDGTDSFAIGSTNNQSQVSDGDYTNMTNYLGTCTKDGSVFVNQIQDRNGDINYNGVYDVYDYAYTMFKLDGGTTKTGSVSGNVKYEVSTTDNGNIQIDVVAQNVQNLNAFGQVLDYDPAALSFVSVTAGEMLADMENLSVNKNYEDGTAYVNLAFANRGDKALVSGSGVLATIIMEPIGEGSVADIDLSTLMLIGPDFSFIEADAAAGINGPRQPELSTGNVTEYGLDDVTITMTNAELTEDEGTNVEDLIQQGSYDGLFDGTQGRDFEFLWDYEANWDETGSLPSYVTLPVTMNIALNEEAKLTDVSVYNANKANGYVTKAEAVLNYSDGTQSEKQTIELEELVGNAAFEFAWADNGKTVASVDITILEAINASGESVTNMMTLSEIELSCSDYAAVTAISAEGNDTTLTVGETADITAVITPEDATNPYFKAESSDPAVAEVTPVADEDNVIVGYQVTGVSNGTATITLTALENEEIAAEYTVTVSGGQVDYSFDNIAGIAMTNAELTEDEGTNVESLIQQGNYDGLFNGTQGRDFEFLWDYEANWDDSGNLPSYVTLPVTLTITMNDGTNLNAVSVYNANKANGYVTKAEAVLNYSDGTQSEKQTIELEELVDNAAFEFAWDNGDKTAVSVEITILEAIDSSGNSATSMMTLSEIELKGTDV